MKKPIAAAAVFATAALGTSLVGDLASAKAPNTITSSFTISTTTTGQDDSPFAWRAVAGANNYKIFMATADGSKKSLSMVLETTNTSFLIAETLNTYCEAVQGACPETDKTHYLFDVIAYDANGNIIGNSDGGFVMTRTINGNSTSISASSVRNVTDFYGNGDYNLTINPSLAGVASPVTTVESSSTIHYVPDAEDLASMSGITSPSGMTYLGATFDGDSTIYKPYHPFIIFEDKNLNLSWQLASGDESGDTNTENTDTDTSDFTPFNGYNIELDESNPDAPLTWNAVTGASRFDIVMGTTSMARPTIVYTGDAETREASLTEIIASFCETQKSGDNSCAENNVGDFLFDILAFDENGNIIANSNGGFVATRSATNGGITTSATHLSGSDIFAEHYASIAMLTLKGEGDDQSERYVPNFLYSYIPDEHTLKTYWEIDIPEGKTYLGVIIEGSDEILPPGYPYLVSDDTTLTLVFADESASEGAKNPDTFDTIPVFAWAAGILATGLVALMTKKSFRR